MRIRLPLTRRITAGALFFLSTFVFGAAALAQDRLTRSERLNDFTSSGWDFKTGTSLADLNRLGKVLRQNASTRPNPHVRGQMDESRVLFFDGLIIDAYFPAKNYSDLLLSSVTITKRKWPVKYGLRVGASRTAVTQSLGDPNEKTHSTAKYCGVSSCVIFSFQNGYISKITWDLYLD